MPVTLFFCYAHEDEVLLDKLKRHLRPLQRQGLLAVWYDRDISPGSPWEQEIYQHLSIAQIILLLVSPDFMDSDYCYGIEMQQALERHARGEAKVIPVILRPTYWQKSPLAPLQALPTKGKPITSALWHDQDTALYDVIEGISHVVEQLVQMSSLLPTVAEATQQQEDKQHEHLQSKGSAQYESDSEAFKTSEEQRTSLSSKEKSRDLKEKGSIPHLSANDGTSFSLSDSIPSIMSANTLHPFTSSPDSSTPPPHPESLPRIDTASAFPRQEVVMVEHQADKEGQQKEVSLVSQRAATHSTQAISETAKSTLLPQLTRSSGSLPSSIATSSSLAFFRRILRRRTLHISCLVVLLISSVLLFPSPIKLPTPPLKKGTAVMAHVDITATSASKSLVRINQLDHAQYNSQQDYSTWAQSTCSSAAMTAVINAYGHNYRIADILKVEAGIHEITPDQGLMSAMGIDKTVAQFGFKTYWLNSLDNVIKVANQGHPVIVGFPPALWSGGDLLVVRGGNSQSVFLVDSSRLNMQVLARTTFMKYWAGFAVVAMPK